MNNQTQNHQPYNRREARRLRRAERRETRGIPSGSTWLVGLILIVLGSAFLIQNMGKFNFPFTNWWALFILIPALGAFERALHFYREANNQVTAQGSGAALSGIVLTLVTLGFLFNISWTYFGPALIILVGLGILLNVMIAKKR